MNDECQALLERWPMASLFNLPPESEVIVIGSYCGLGISLIDELWHPKRITGYDPQIWACDEARIRLAGRDNCEIIEYGLGRYNTTLPMGEWHTDACSFINTGPGSRLQGMGHVWDANQVLKHRYPEGQIDLVVMNIEGDEFNLLPFLEDKGWLDRLDRLAVQWHLGLGDNPKDKLDMDVAIEHLIYSNGFKLTVDERPSWTLMVHS